MARGINHVTLVGTLLSVPELKYTSGGLAIATFTLGGNHPQEGGRAAIFYHRITLFGKPAEWLIEAEHPVGASILVAGRLNYRAWEDQEGNRRTDVGIIADVTQVLNGAHHTHVKDKKGQERLERGLNSVVMFGNLTREPETRTTENGNVITNFGLAVNESKQVNGKWEDTPHFINATAWNTVGQSLEGATKGAPVLVIGQFETDSWTDKDGNRRFAQKVNAERVEVAAPRGGTPAARPARPAPKQQEIIEEFPPKEALPF